jgi:hypothetical protein
MKIRIAVASIIFAVVGAASANVEFIWGVTGVAGAPSTFYAINPANGQVYGQVGSSGTVCLSGLAIQPGSGTLLALQGQLSPTGTSAKRLFRIDRNSGLATPIASMANTHAISDVAMRSDGTLFGFAINGAIKKLVTINTATAALAEIGAVNNITNVCLTFGTNGTLYLARTNALFTVNTATGVMTLVSAITGATTSIDNFMATRSNGQIYVGQRSGGSTVLYAINPTTAVTTVVGTASGVALSGMAFDSAAAPTLARGKVKKKVTKASVTIKGAVTGIGAKVKIKNKFATIANGNWSIKAKLKTGKNRLTIIATDVFGQAVQTKVTVTREQG